jgi:hypothetical protein
MFFKIKLIGFNFNFHFNFDSSRMHRSITLLLAIFISSLLHAQQAAFSLSDTMPCTNDTLVLNDLSTGSINDWQWIIDRNGQLDTLTGPGPHHIVPGAGAHIGLQLRVADTTSSDSISRIINLRPAPVANIFVFGQNPFCANDGVLLDGGFHESYQWSTGDTTGSIAVDTSGQFWVKVTAPNGCCTYDTLETTALPGPSVAISPGGSIDLCEGDSIRLNGGSHAGYLWNGMTGDSNFVANQSGTVVLNVSFG